MKTIALVYGGKSLESEVSVLTALKIKDGIPKDKYQYLLVYLDQNNNFFVGEALSKLENYEEKNNFKKAKLVIKKDKHYFHTLTKNYYFDDVLIVGHGKNIEDGKISSFFSSQGIDVYGHNEEASFLMQNKHLFKSYLKANRIPTLPHILVHKYELNNSLDNIKNILDEMGFPLIIKGCRLGSSIGVYKVNNMEEVERYLNKAFIYENEVIIEKYLSNKIEVNIALLGYQDEITYSSFEIVNTSSLPLSFLDKYDYSSSDIKRKITPLSDEKIAVKIKGYCKKIFTDLGLCGVVRCDFLLEGTSSKIYLNEVNSIPGSLAYYLFENNSLSLCDVLQKIIDYGKRRNDSERQLKTTYEDDFLFSSKYLGLKNKMSL